MTNDLTVKQAVGELKAMKKHIEPYMSVVGVTAYDMAIKALEQTSWIPVSERLPQKGEQVLAASKHFGMVVAEFDCVKYNDIEEKFFLTHYSIDSDEMAVIEVEYWMPLPEPYKGESEDAE